MSSSATPVSPVIRVAVVEDDPTFRAAFVAAIEAAPDTEVAAVAGLRSEGLVKHSGADRVAVTTQQRGDAVVVAVEDSGRGFDPAVVQNPGRGLANVQRRATAIGATAQWISKNGGTRFELALPLHKLEVPAITINS